MRVTLSKDDFVLELDPCAGGAVSAFRHRDLDLLRPAPERIGPAFDPLSYAAFMMVPFVGRIHNGQFECDGRAIELQANLPPEPHAIHGHGWRAAWKVESTQADTATLVYNHAADAWPWDYTARQVFRLTETGLLVDLSVTNQGATRMPAGLGWHPYFLRDGAQLNVGTTHVWTPDENTGENAPQTITAVADLSGGRSVSTLNLDTSFSVEPQPFRMTWSTHTVTMVFDDIFQFATIYVPPEQNYFCVEPISHAPNAVNSALPDADSGFRWLAPGETLAGSVELIIEH